MNLFKKKDKVVISDKTCMFYKHKGIVTDTSDTFVTIQLGDLCRVVIHQDKVKKRVFKKV